MHQKQANISVHNASEAVQQFPHIMAGNCNTASFYFLLTVDNIGDNINKRLIII